jgi:fructan beta-fructosidase
LITEDQKIQKWIMLVSINPGGIYGGSATQYFVGSFDGQKFTNDNPPSTTLWIDYGKDNYAGVTWSDIPEQDGRRIFLGWMSNWQYANEVPTKSWRSAMTIPRTLHLTNTAEGLRLASRPVKEMDNIRKESYDVTSGEINGMKKLTDIPFNIATSEMVFEFELSESGINIGVEISNEKEQKVLIGFDSALDKFYVDRTNSGLSDFSDDFPGIHHAPRIEKSKKLKLHLIIDVASIELFADDGQVVITDIFFPDDPFSQVTIFSHGGSAKLTSGKITHLSSIHY